MGYSTAPPAASGQRHRRPVDPLLAVARRRGEAAPGRLWTQGRRHRRRQHARRDEPRPGGAGPNARSRWSACAGFERDPPQTRIDVNIAATFLDYWRDGQHIDRREVVAGEPDKQTPQIQAPIVNLVAYPKWHVPDSIGSDELSKKSQAWLQENHFAMENGKFVQESGPKNSLGIVKFDMDDKQSIYLHDTPAKALFGTSRPAPQPRLRASPGCSRLRQCHRDRRRRRRQVPASHGGPAGKMGETAEPIPVRADLPHRILGWLGRSVPARRLRLGQCGSGRARPHPGSQLDAGASRAATSDRRND